MICRSVKSKQELIRFIRIADQVIYDLSGKINQRGYYVCNDNNCLQKLPVWQRKKRGKQVGKKSI
ncbi:MAG: YlxR family protein [Candidatus Cloacimonetes bacterium]|nr:YlxR family protein [Candidatus Cloacimonadota bacterium]